jgi:hypothetical protein
LFCRRESVPHTQKHHCKVLLCKQTKMKQIRSFLQETLEKHILLVPFLQTRDSCCLILLPTSHDQGIYVVDLRTVRKSSLDQAAQQKHTGKKIVEVLNIKLYPHPILPSHITFMNIISCHQKSPCMSSLNMLPLPSIYITTPSTQDLLVHDASAYITYRLSHSNPLTP